MNDKLARAFRSYNRKYFDNELPPVTLRWAKLPDALMGYYDREDEEIVLHSSLKTTNALWRLTLLHEMVHLKGWRWGHGPKFQNEMRRLANAGAFDNLW